MSATLLSEPVTAPGPVSTADPSTLATIDLLLRDRAGFLKLLEDGVAVLPIARALLLTIGICAAVFGATLGLYRGGIQVLFAATKLPLAVLLTAAVCAPVLSAVSRVVHRTTDVRRDLLLVLSALALGSLILAALVPLVLLGVHMELSYHDLTLVVVGCSAIGGLVGLRLLRTGLKRRGPGHWQVTLVLLVTFAMVGSQMAWALRPYLVRPRTPEVPFVRAVEGSFLESVIVSSRSSAGIYVREAAPLPGEEGRR